MAVLVEFTTVVVVNSSLERLFPGDAEAFVGMLAQFGFVNPWHSQSEDIVVVEAEQGEALSDETLPWYKRWFR